MTESRAEGAPPVAKWESLADPILLVQQMWNHSFRMRQAFASHNIEWQILTTDELADILAYLRSLPETGAADVAVFQHLGAGRRPDLPGEGLRELPRGAVGPGEPAA